MSCAATIEFSDTSRQQAKLIAYLIEENLVVSDNSNALPNHQLETA